MFSDPRVPISKSQIMDRFRAARAAGNPTIAIGWLNLLLADDPGNLRLSYMVGRTLLVAGRYDEAAAWLDRGIDYHLGDHYKENTQSRSPLCVIGMPRSASTNLTNTLAAFTNRPIMELGFGELAPRLDIHLQEKYLKGFVDGGYVSHSHLNATHDNLRRLSEAGIKKIFVQVRDPRQALASFHKYSTASWEILSRLNFVYTGYNFLPPSEQMLLLAVTYYPSLLSWMKSWEDARDEGKFGIEVVIGRFEDMVEKRSDYLTGLSGFLDVPESDLPAIIEKGRRTPPEGEWRHNLDERQQSVLDEGLRSLQSQLYSV